MHFIIALSLLLLYISQCSAGALSCQRSSTQGLPRRSPVNDVTQYILQFCNPPSPLAVSDRKPLINHWTVDSRVVEIRAEVNVLNDTCRDVTFDISGANDICQDSLALITDNCEGHDIQDDLLGSFQGEGCDLWTLDYYNADKLSRRASSSRFESFTKKGGDFMEQLEGLLESPRAQTGNKISEDEMNKKYKLSYPKVTLGSVSLGVSNYLKQKFRMSTNEEIYDVNVVYRKSNRLYYHNYYSPSRGLIVASDNVANAMGIKMPHAWSNVTWHVWTKACQMETPPVHPSTLRAIIRDRVVNSDSSDILKEAFARSGHDLAAIAKSGKKTTTQLTWSRTDKSFYAIIGTPNGKGIVWLLREQSGILKKTVKSITAWATNFGTKDKPEWSWNVVFQLGRYEPDEDCGCSGMGCIIA